jgi:hypothetical protein
VEEVENENDSLVSDNSIIEDEKGNYKVGEERETKTDDK